MLDLFKELFGWLPKEAFAALISMVPIIELRGGLPYAILSGINPLVAFPLCIGANLLPIPFILWFITPIFSWLKKTKRFRPMVEKLEARAMKKKGSVEMGYFWGLLLFVGIPLPGTGAWTGALGASFLNMGFKSTTLSVSLGVIIAGIIMALASTGVFAIF